MKSVFTVLLLCMAVKVLAPPPPPLFRQPRNISKPKVTTSSYVFVKSATSFSSSYINRNGALTGASDSGKCLFSVWFKTSLNLSSEVIFAIDNASDTTKFRVTRNSSNKIAVSGNLSSGSGILAYTGSAAITPSSSTWHHLAFSFDLSDAAKRWLYLDGVSEGGTWNTYTSGNINFSAIHCGIAGTYAGTSLFSGSLSEVYFATGTYYDSTIVASLISGGHPVSLGATGQLPTGSSPILYLHNPNTSFYTDCSASGNNYVAQGVLGNDASVP